jgi:hypothetical protein
LVRVHHRFRLRFPSVPRLLPIHSRLVT